MLPLSPRYWREVPALPERMEQFLDTAMDQVRWKRAKAPLRRELETHLLDQQDACLEQGMAPEEAQAEAVRQMGDPVVVGQELDRVHRPQPQWGLLGLTLLLALTGGILRVGLTAAMPDAIQVSQTVLALLLGCGCLLGAYFLDYTFLGRYARAVYWGAVVLGGLSLLFSPNYNNASYYTRYVVLLYPVAYAVLVYALRGKGWKGLALAILGGVPLAVIAMLAPYLLGLVILLVTDALLLLCAVCRDWFGVGKHAGTLALVLLLLLCGALCLYCGLSQGYFQKRLTLLLHPEADALGAGYMATAIQSALAGAQWLGEGTIGGFFGDSSTPYWMLVPESGRDALLTTLIHRLGWMPFLALMLTVAGTLVWVLVKCLRQKNELGRLISLAVVLTLGLQAVSSLLLTLGYPFTSGTFPLLVGNLHSILDMGLLGLALSVFRQEKMPLPSRSSPLSGPSRRPVVTWRDGELVIALRRN